MRDYSDRRRFRSGPPPEPKPFFWIPLPEGRQKRNAPELHDRFRGLSGFLDLELRVLSDYLYMGSGSILLNSRDQAYYSFARRGGRLIIPATGIKGPVRSVVEAISNSCVSQVAKKDNFYRSEGPCKIEKDQEAKASLCPACRLFGTTGYRGRTYFEDAEPIGDVKTEIVKISDLWPPKQAIGRKFYQIKTFQRLDDKPERNHRFLEAVPKSSVFSTRLYFENTSAAEMSLLIRAIGLPIKIGGAKPRCLGAVKLDIKDRGLWMIPTGKTGLFKSIAAGGVNEPLKENLREWSNDKSLLDEIAWEKLKLDSQVQSEQCPRGMY
jgi:CRISPR/Cas system CSM-associated protein Csm3 (group 7 of RAMP superfamily)